MAQHIAASIEVTPRQVLEGNNLEGLFPGGTRVYLTDVGTDAPQVFVQSAQYLKELGYIAVPHIAVRRISGPEAFERRVSLLANEAGVTEMLIVGGGLNKPFGVLESAMDALETGALDRHGIRDIGIAGHPEGTPDFDQDVAYQALSLKKQFADRTNANMYIVTQFGFDAANFIAWAEQLREHGIDLPVHLGVAGPAKFTTLLKFAIMCGVGPSLQFVKTRASSLTTLMSGFDPEIVVTPIETHVQDNPDSAIAQIHVFPFGGVRGTAEWLKARGSWTDADESVAKSSTVR